MSDFPTSLLRTAALTLSFIRRLQAKADPPDEEEKEESCEELPNFSGEWLLHHVEGDPEALLKEVGASWVQRKAAAAMGFGVGRQFVNVDQCPTSITVETSYRQPDTGEPMSFPRPTNNTYSTDGSEQDSMDPEGRTLRTRASWDGHTLTMVSERVGCDKKLPSTRRYLQSSESDEEELVFEQTSPDSGICVKRVYRRYVASGERTNRSSRSVRTSKSAKSRAQ